MCKKCSFCGNDTFQSAYSAETALFQDNLMSKTTSASERQSANCAVYYPNLYLSGRNDHCKFLLQFFENFLNTCKIDQKIVPECSINVSASSEREAKEGLVKGALGTRAQRAETFKEHSRTISYSKVILSINLTPLCLVLIDYPDDVTQATDDVTQATHTTKDFLPQKRLHSEAAILRQLWAEDDNNY